MDKELLRDSYGKVDFINMPFQNTGSVSDICEKFQDPILDKAMQKLSDAIDNSYKNSDIYGYIQKKYGI
ncbi:CJH_07325 family protein [Campylobacter insulaenigrae]|uniref:CJH_07325 family protein n=1 Tax=Campylobacter insulaenigrae TaxID=260714 RepID=UPI002152FC1F|nr:CJH_07325 family protein [Campylobacter insulaenigrae]MCR6588431.1 CJH_07325 family protein [Campylobacter insulaenigrae]